ncbi:MAG: hypothetical protein JRI80_17185 [Deltaproteobacteria bacterium]|nr:hypothetical protein [Deltaproteobacteria bacterium]
MSVKTWLLRRPLFGYAVEPFGEAYDISSVATEIGGQQFDLSFKLMDGNSTKKIAYVECKFRNEDTGNINAEFKKFAKAVYKAILGCSNTEQLKNAEFLFISNIPPDKWRKFINNRAVFLRKTICDENGATIEEAAIGTMVTSFHILVLSQIIVEGRI